MTYKYRKIITEDVFRQTKVREYFMTFMGILMLWLIIRKVRLIMMVDHLYNNSEKDILYSALPVINFSCARALYTEN